MPCISAYGAEIVEPPVDTRTYIDPSVVTENLIDNVFTDIYEGLTAFSVEKSLLNPDLMRFKNPDTVLNPDQIEIDVPSFKTPTIALATAKQNFVYRDSDSHEHTCYCYCVVPYCDNFCPTSIDELQTVSSQGHTYYINCINFEISIGTEIYHYFIRSSTYSDTQTGCRLQFRSNGGFSADMTTSYHDFYQYDWDGSNLREIATHSVNGSGITANLASTNEAVYNFYEAANLYYSNSIDSFGLYFHWRDGSLQLTPDPPTLCGFGEIRQDFYNRFTQRNVSYGVYNHSHWVVEYGTNNIPSGTDYRQITINRTYKSGDTVTINNYNSYYNNAYSEFYNTIKNTPSADVDINTLLADLSANILGKLQPTLDLGFNNLDGSIKNFLRVMPQIGFEWGQGDTVNYLDFAPIVTTSVGGGGNCNWVTPSFPAYNTDLDIAVSVPTFATATINSDIMYDVGELFSQTWNFAEILGISALILPLFVLGIIWRLTGGE